MAAEEETTIDEPSSARGHVDDRDRTDTSGRTHEQDEGSEDARSDLIAIIVGAALFAVGIACEHLGAPQWAMVVAYVVAYLVTGGEILLKAVRNIRHGQVFDENFLMSIATIGAIAIQAYPEAVGVMLFYRVGEFFEDRAVDKSRDQIMDAVDMRPETVNRVVGTFELDRSGSPDGELSIMSSERFEVASIPAADVQVGELVLVRPGDRIPLDGMVVEGESRIDTSPVTGEPVPRLVVPGRPVISGCMNMSGALLCQVTKPLSESMVSRILDSVENAAASKPQIERSITRFARVYTPIVIGIAALTAVLPSILTGDWHYWVYTALTFLVISCPCAIVISVPLAFFAGIGAGSKLGILFKGGVSLEALRQVKAVVMDKTGTITQGVFAVQEVDLLPASRVGAEELLVLAAAAESTSTHPIGQSVVEAARADGHVLPTVISVEEVAGKGVRAQVLADGREYRVLCGNDALLEEDGIACTVDHERIPGAVMHVAVDGVLSGSIFIADAPKPDSGAAIASLAQEGIYTVMLTGDAEKAARSIGSEMKIDEVHACLLPDQKFEALSDVRARKGASLFVGDGINDAPVLAGADVGAAMGSGADAAIEAADVVFMNSSLMAVPASIRLARYVGRIAQQDIVFALTVKLGVMVLGFIGLASMWTAVFADVGVAILCIMNSIRILHRDFS